MLTLGASFSGGKNSAAYDPVVIGDKNPNEKAERNYLLNYVKIQNAEYDDLFITSNITDNIYDLDISEEQYTFRWDWDTILWAPFNRDMETGNAGTNAGNVNWSAAIISRILIKVRELNPTPYGKVENPWITIYYKEIENNPDNFKIANYSYYLGKKGIEYEFAVVSMIGNQEQQYILATNLDTSYPIPNRIKSDFDKTFIIGNNHYDEEGNYVVGNVFSTSMGDGKIDTTRNIPSANVELLYHKYPVHVRNSIANYDTGNCSGIFLPVEDGECVPIAEVLAPEMDGVRTYYQKIVMDFIADGLPKILKSFDGRAWMIQATPNPTDTTEDIYNKRNLTFQWVEIGDLQSEEDLFVNGFSDIPAVYWRY